MRIHHNRLIGGADRNRIGTRSAAKTPRGAKVANKIGGERIDDIGAIGREIIEEIREKSGDDIGWTDGNVISEIDEEIIEGIGGKGTNDVGWIVKRIHQ
jgi:hypothetical protein